MATTASLTLQQLTSDAAAHLAVGGRQHSLMGQVLDSAATGKLEGALPLDQAYTAARRTLDQDPAAAAVTVPAICWGMPEGLYIPADAHDWALALRSDGHWETLTRDDDGVWDSWIVTV